MGPRITLFVRNYDFLAPLVCGDVTAEGMDLTLDRNTAGGLDRTIDDPSVHAGETSFGKYIQRTATADRRVVGIPFFVNRAFRHRCFYVRRDSGLQDFGALARRRVGTDDWRTSGNTWSRALLRDAGVDITKMEWWIGGVDAPPATRPTGPRPPYVHLAAPDRTLSQMLVDGELDAVMSHEPPRAFSEPHGPIVRLVPDYRQAEREYFRRTGLYPVQHIIVMKRDVFDRDPQIAAHLYAALERSKTTWQRGRRELATMPWAFADVEDTVGAMGEDWHPNGVEPNRKVIQAFLDEQLAQGLIPGPLSVEALFSDFQRVAQA